MDITKFIVASRAQSYGDNSTYHTQLSRRLLKCRKRLGITTKHRGKYTKDDVTAENIAENGDYVHLVLLTSERAWAEGMSMRAAHVANANGITGHTRSHIISRIDKAAKTAESLVSALSETEISGATTTDVLEAFAYAGLMRGAANFEKQCWEPCLKNYAVSRAVYTALTTSSANGDTFKDLLSETIDPSMQYAAYQLKTPRTVPIQVIARKAFPQNNATLVNEINRLDPNVLRQGGPESSKGLAEDVPKTLSWRGREVRIEDAQIALAWAATDAAKSRLTEKLSSPSADSLTPREIAAAYEEVLTASQDAVDATNQAIGELRAEDVPQTDPRMQSLQITRTAVNYEMISWRIGRNRVLTGKDDGAPEDYTETLKRKAKKQGDVPKAKDVKATQKVAKLKERVALYDGALQSLEEVLALPGVPADEELSGRLKASAQYFTALKCLAIARSHALAGSNANALGLLHHAHTQLSTAIPLLSEGPQPRPRAPLNIVVSAASATSLCEMLAAQVTRYRALVHIDNIRKSKEKQQGQNEVPLIDRMSEYPVGGVVDLENIVEYPPRPPFVPLKPVLLDLAWNHINYPKPDEAEKNDGAPEAKPQKKGWFGFGS